MSKETLIEAVRLAGGQAHLAAGIRRRIPGSKVGQVHVWGWLNAVKMSVPPADVVLAISEHLDYQLTPHDLRPDLYPNPSDALPLGVRVEIPAPHQEAAPVRALACATQSVRLTADRREGPRRADRVDAPQPNQLPLAIEAGERYWEAE